MPGGNEEVLIVQEAGWVPWPVWMDTENLVSTGIWYPDFPALPSRHNNYRNRMDYYG